MVPVFPVVVTLVAAVGLAMLVGGAALLAVCLGYVVYDRVAKFLQDDC